VATIEYLAFEGGGGKGAAYLGALKYLKDIGFLRFNEPKSGTNEKRRLDPICIKGISGSSAGAITAVLLASGHNCDDIYNILLDTKRFEGIYKDTHRDQIPVIFSRRGKDSLKLNLLKMLKNNSKDQAPYYFSNKTYLLINLIKRMRDIYDSSLFGIRNVSKESGEFLKESFFYALNSLYFDLGILDGETVREIIRERLGIQFGDSNITFAQMHEETHIHLRITGTCINTAETIWFDHLGVWKNMAVADAVRISISVPLIFKPVAITYDAPDLNRGTGTGFLFADGGILNNAPIHAFNFPGKPMPIGKCEAMLMNSAKTHNFDRGQLNKNILLIRLDVEKIPEIIGIDSYLPSLLNAVTSLSETSQLLSHEEIAQTITLSTDGLSTLDFIISSGTKDDPKKTAKDKLDEFIKRSYKEMEDGLRKTPFMPENIV